MTTLAGGAWNDSLNGGFWDANDASAQSTILSGQSTADWLRVDLGAAYSIRYIVYDNRYYNTQQFGVGMIYQQTFDIQVSTNGTTWTTVVARSGQTTAQKYVFAITPVTARYVRVTNVLSQFTANSTWHYVYATELQVYSAATWGGAVTPIKHYYLGGRRVATRDADGLKYLHADHLGSTGRLSNASGVPVRSVWYDSWGRVVADTSGAGLAYKFTGQELDGTELYDYGARAYDPALGRFLSADTIVPNPENPSDFNRYSYTRNNPLKYTDPTGHCIPGEPGCPYSDEPHIMPPNQKAPSRQDRLREVLVVGGMNWISGRRRDTLTPLLQNQLPDAPAGCPDYSAAMAFNLLTGKNVSGWTVQSFMALTFHQIGGLGLPPSEQAAGLNQMFQVTNQPFVAEYRTGGTEADLVNNLNQGYVTLVTVSWGAGLLGRPTREVGHTLVVVGYDASTSQFAFLDPYLGELVEDFASKYGWDFSQAWQKQPNWFIPAGSMVTIKPK